MCYSPRNIDQKENFSLGEDPKTFFFLATQHVGCGILVLQLGVEPVTPAEEVWSLNHWTAREVP